MRSIDHSKRPRRRLSNWLVLAVGLACVPGLARADARDDSRKKFQLGVTLALAEKYRDARDAFLEAYRLYPHASILLNLGLARWKSGELPDAEQDLSKFLSDNNGGSEEDMANARAALVAVRAKLGTLRLRVGPDGARAKLDGQYVALVPGEFAEMRAVVGEHLLDAKADGFVAKRQTVNIEAGRPTLVDVRLEPDAKEPAGTGTRHVVGWTLVGTGGALGLLGLLSGVRAQSLALEYNSEPAGAQDPNTRRNGLFLRTAADIAFVSALAAGSVGAYLLLVPGASGKTALSGFIGVGVAGLRGGF